MTSLLVRLVDGPLAGEVRYVDGFAFEGASVFFAHGGKRYVYRRFGGVLWFDHEEAA